MWNGGSAREHREDIGEVDDIDLPANDIALLPNGPEQANYMNGTAKDVALSLALSGKADDMAAPANEVTLLATGLGAASDDRYNRNEKSDAQDSLEKLTNLDAVTIESTFDDKYPQMTVMTTNDECDSGLTTPDIAQMPNTRFVSRYDEGQRRSTPEDQTGSRASTQDFSLKGPHSPFRGSVDSLSSIGSSIFSPAPKDVQVLQESTSTAIIKIGQSLRISSSEVLSTSSFDAFLEYVTEQRLRRMPHQGSRWDKIFKWAESFARTVDSFSSLVSKSFESAFASARFLWSCCRIILQMDASTARTLEKIFLNWYEMAQTLQFFLEYKELSLRSSKLMRILALVFVDMVKVCSDMTVRCKSLDLGARFIHPLSLRLADLLQTATLQSVFLSDFTVQFGWAISSLLRRKHEFLIEIWNVSLDGLPHETDNQIISFETIRAWLAHQDQKLWTSFGRRDDANIILAEFTFQWFPTILNDFMSSSQSVFCISGQPGSGKSHLTEFILEHLRMNHERRTKLLSYSFAAEIPSHNSPINMFKSLLLQLLEKSAGDLSLFTTLCKAYDRIERKHQPNSASVLWDVFQDAILAERGSVFLVVDGLDLVEGGSTAALQLCEQIQLLFSRRRNLKCIFLTRPLPGNYPPGIRGFGLDPGRIQQDIREYIKQWIRESRVFARLEIYERETILRRLLERSFHSFLEAQLMLQLLELESNYLAMIRRLDEAMGSAFGVLDVLCSRLDFKNSITRQVISWLLVAQRALTLKELTKFADIRAIRDSKGIESEIRMACGSLVEIRDGAISFSHRSMKEHLYNLCAKGKLPLSIQEAHKDASLSNLAYIKASLQDVEIEPSFEEDFKGETLETYQRKTGDDTALQYAIRFYLTHYKKSSMYETSSVYSCPPQLKHCFVDSIFLALVERRWWKLQIPVEEAKDMHTLAVSLRCLVFGRRGKSVIQSYINVGQLQLRLSMHLAASGSFYQCWNLSRTLLGVDNPVCLSAAKAYLDIVTTHNASFGSQIDTDLERIYIYIWTFYKDTYGEGHEETLKYAELLAALHKRLRRLDKAASIYREIYEVYIRMHGHLHETSLSAAWRLIEVLESLSNFDDCSLILGRIIDASTDSLDGWDSCRISATIRFVRICEIRKLFAKAESALRSLYRELSEAGPFRSESQVHVAYLEISLELAYFLIRRGRNGEASKIVIAVTGRYDGTNFRRHSTDDSILAKLRLLGDVLRSLNMLAEAEKIYSRLWQWYRETSRTSHKEAVLLALALSQCYHGLKINSNGEGMLRELFDILIAEESIQSVLITVCTELAALYERASKWSQSLEVYRRLLIRLWPRVLSRGSTFGGLPDVFAYDSITIAFQLAISHLKLGRVGEAESIYLFIFRSCKSSMSLSNEWIMKAAERLANCYQEEEMIDKAISFWKELRVEYLTAFGSRHKFTIRISYYLAQIYQKNGMQDLDDIMNDIIECFGDESDSQDIASFDTLWFLRSLFEGQGKRTELLRLYRSLWTILYDDRKDASISAECFLEVFMKYIVLLQEERGLSEAIALAREFHAICIRRFGWDSYFSQKAAMELAAVLEKESARNEEAIKIYEEVCGTSLELHADQARVEILVLLARERLAVLYGYHPKTAPKAEIIYIETWEKAKRRYGCAHIKSLSCLEELVTFYMRRNIIDPISSAHKTLQQAIMEILTQEEDNQRLFDSAQAIAGLYIQLESREIAYGLSRAIRASFEGVNIIPKQIFGLDVAQLGLLDKRSLIFVESLEENLKSQPRSGLLIEITRDLMVETCVYEAWLRALHYGGRLENRLAIGARLLSFLKRKSRHAEEQRVFEEMWIIFHRELGIGASRSGTLWTLFETFISELCGGSPSAMLFSSAAAAVQKCFDLAEFQQCFDLATWLFGFIKQRGGFVSKQLTTLGFNLMLCLVSRHSETTVRDTRLREMMYSLSIEILVELLKGGMIIELDFKSTRPDQLNILIRILGERKQWTQLERILQTLWDARTHMPWDSIHIISIGRRLCEVRFAAGHTSVAIDLAEDIYYNTRSSFGPLHATTIAVSNLLSKFYTNIGKHGNALSLHSDFIRRTLDSDEYEQKVLTNTAWEQARYFEFACRRQTTWDQHRHDDLANLVNRLKTAYKEHDSCDRWHSLGDVEGWKKSEEELPATEEYGFYQEPMDWGFLDTGFIAED